LVCLAEHQTCEADGGKTDLEKTKTYCTKEISASDPCFDTADGGTGG
jgi:hypothetical protein